MAKFSCRCLYPSQNLWIVRPYPLSPRNLPAHLKFRLQSLKVSSGSARRKRGPAISERQTETCGAETPNKPPARSIGCLPEPKKKKTAATQWRCGTSPARRNHSTGQLLHGHWAHLSLAARTRGQPPPVTHRRESQTERPLLTPVLGHASSSGHARSRPTNNS